MPSYKSLNKSRTQTQTPFSESMTMIKPQKSKASAQYTPSAPPTTPPSAPTITTSSFMGDILSGFSLGVGSSLGHRAVNSLFGTPTTNVKVTTVEPDDPCGREYREYIECINNAKEDTSAKTLPCHVEHVSFYECNIRKK